MSYIYNGKHTHINTQSQPDGLSKVFIFFSRRGLHSRHSLFCFFLSWYRPPPVSPCDSQWAERRKRRVEAAGAPRRFYPLLHPTFFFFGSFVCMCVCAGTLTQQSLKAFGGCRARGSVRCFPVAVLQLATYPTEEPSASALPMSQPLCLIRDTGPKPIQLMCSHNAQQIHPALHPFTPPSCPKKSPLQPLSAAAAVFSGWSIKDINHPRMIFS